MKRNEFLKCCTAGVYSCAALGWLPLEAAGGAGASGVQATTPPDPEMDELRWKLGAVQTRFAKLIGILNKNMDAPTRRKILHELGGECSRSHDKLFAQYKGNLRGFLDHIQTQWVEKAEYDESAGVIRIVEKSRRCTCPFVKLGETPGDFCDCTLGWQRAAYSAILGRPVEAEIEESLLRGGSRCVFRIRIA